jgi:hypothetical protein
VRDYYQYPVSPVIHPVNCGMMKKLEPEVAEAVSRAIGNVSQRKILSCIAMKAKSVEEIASETGIPLATCYRDVHALRDMKLLAVGEIILNSSGKKYEKFIRTFKHLRISLDSDGISVWDDDPPVTPTSAIASEEQGPISFQN